MKLRMKTVSVSLRKDLTWNDVDEGEDTLVEEGPRLNDDSIFQTHATVRFTTERVMTSGSRVKRVLTRAVAEVEKDIVTFNEEEYEDILLEGGPQIESGTVLHRDTRHRAIHQRNICDKWFPREACFDFGDVEVEKDIVTFIKEEDEDSLLEEGPDMERCR